MSDAKPITLDTIMGTLPPERCARIEARAATLIAEHRKIQDEIPELQRISAELRHVYENIVNETVGAGRQKEFANGLVAPQIRRLELLIERLRAEDV